MPNKSVARLRLAVPYLTRVVVGLALLSGAVVLFTVLRSTQPQPARKADTGLALLVETVGVQELVISRPWAGYGTARAMASSRVASQVSGRVVERPNEIEAGRAVDVGEVLVRLESADYERRAASIDAVLASLRAELNQLEVEAASLDEQLTMVLEETEIARREYERSVRAFEADGAGTRAEVDQRLSALRRAEREASALDQRSRLIPARQAVVRANIDARQSEYEQAIEDIARATIASPINGVIQSLSLDTGDFAQVGSEVALIVDLRRLEVPLLLPSSAIADISIGDRVEVFLESRPDRAWVGTVARVAPQADASTRSVRVFVEIVQDPSADPSVLLRPGQFVMGRVIPQHQRAHLLVPRRAVVQGGVLVADSNSDSRARRVETRALFSLDLRIDGAPENETQWLAVEAELSPGERVLVTNLDDVRDGSPIRVEHRDWGQGP